MKVDPQLGLAMMQGAGPEKLQEKLSPLIFSNGTTASLAEIGTVNSVQINGISLAELDSINLDYAEHAAGREGETIRDVISMTHHCRNCAEEDRFLRRLLAFRTVRAASLSQPERLLSKPICIRGIAFEKSG